MTDHTPVLQRFLRYVAIDTQSSESSESYPSTAKQKDLSRLLVGELRELGVADAEIDEHGYVMGTVASNVDVEVPTIGLIAHVDTSPEVSGTNVKPQLHENYGGGPIVINDEITLTPELSPALDDHIGHTVVTTDGSTLLGADDKAGIAEIMTLVERLRDDPSIPHGELRIGFTVDEEVGTGTKFFDVKKFGATYAYTVDGESPGEVENETFCADSAKVVFTGINVHPGYAKDKLVNAAKAAAFFVSRLPKDKAPETTSGKQGYLHPVSVAGSVEQTIVKLILRDFEEEPLRAFRGLLEEIAHATRETFPGVRVGLAFEESYRNMRFVLDDHPQVTEVALEAVRRAGLEPKLNSIRGGTDGARLSYMGLPTPNIFAGGHLFHSRTEWIAVEAMEAAVKTLEQLVQIWVERSRA
jgi:tripeptide aminopeptidase